MGLQRINWTQIDSMNVPTGTTVDLGTINSQLHAIYTENIYVSGISITQLILLNLSGSTGINILGNFPNLIVENTLPDQTVIISGGTGIEVMGTYPNFYITTDGYIYGNISGATGLLGSQVITALGYIPYDSSNPSGYISGYTYTTGGTYDNGTLLLTDNIGSLITIPGFYTGTTTTLSGGTGINIIGTYPNFSLINTLPDQIVNISGGTNVTVIGNYPNYSISSIDTNTYITGGTYNNGVLSLINNSGSTINITGLTSTDTFVTGFTYSNNVFLIKQNQGRPDLTVSISGSVINSITIGNGLSGLTINGITNIVNTSPNQIVSISGGTGIITSGIYPNFTVTNTAIDSNTYITDGTYNNGTLSLNSNSGTTVNISGFTTTDSYTTGFTYTNNQISIKRNQGLSDLSVIINNMTGLTINGILSATTINANNIVNSITTGNGLSGNTNSGIVNLVNTSPDRTVSITGGTYISVTGSYPNFAVTTTGLPDAFTTGFTYSNNTFSLKRNQGQPDLSATINVMTGLTINGILVTSGATASMTNNTTNQNVLTLNKTATAVFNGSGVVIDKVNVINNNYTGVNNNSVPNGGVGGFGSGTISLDIQNTSTIYSNQGASGGYVSTLHLNAGGTTTITTGATNNNYGIAKFNPLFIDNNGSNNSIYSLFDITPTIRFSNSDQSTNNFNGLRVNPAFTVTGGGAKYIFGSNGIVSAMNVGSGYQNVTHQAFASTPVFSSGLNLSLTGFYHNPTIGAGGQTYHRAFWNTTGDNVFNSTSGVVMVGTTTSTGDKLQVNGNLNLTTAGNKLKIATGTNASVGTVVLTGGTATVNTTAALTNSIIMLTTQIVGGTIGIQYISARVNGVSFTITSNNILDTSTVGYQIIN